MPCAAVDPRALLPGTGFVVRDAKAAARYRYSLRRMEAWRGKAWREALHASLEGCVAGGS